MVGDFLAIKKAEPAKLSKAVNWVIEKLNKARESFHAGNEPKTTSPFIEYFINCQVPQDYDTVLEEGFKYTRVLKLSSAQDESKSDGSDSFGSEENQENQVNQNTSTSMVDRVPDTYQSQSQFAFPVSSINTVEETDVVSNANEMDTERTDVSNPDVESSISISKLTSDDVEMDVAAPEEQVMPKKVNFALKEALKDTIEAIDEDRDGAMDLEKEKVLILDATSVKKSGFQVPAAKNDVTIASVTVDVQPLSTKSKTSGFQVPTSSKFGGFQKSASNVVSPPTKKALPSSSSSSSKNSKGMKKPKMAKKEKDPNAPIVAKSAYILFSAKHRSTMNVADMKPSEVMKALGEAWKGADDDTKAPFLTAAAEDKARHTSEMTKYRADHPELAELANKQTKRKKSSEGDSKSGPSKSKKSKKSKEKAKKSVASGVGDEEEEDEDEFEAVETTVNEDSSSSSSSIRTSSRVKESLIASEKGSVDVLVLQSTPPMKQSAAPPSLSRSGKETATSLKAKQRENEGRAALACSSLPKKGIKQDDLQDEEDLLNAKVTLFTTTKYEDDYQPAVGDDIALVLAPYRDLMKDIPSALLSEEDKAACEEICSSDKPFTFCTISGLEDIDCPDGSALQLLTVQEGKDGLYSILHVPNSSPLQLSDLYLMKQDEFKMSLKQPCLVLGAQVRRQFALPEGEEKYDETHDAMWIEGTVYDIKSDKSSDPYNSIKVVWICQEHLTEDWLYAYDQTDCNCSPWDLRASQYILPENQPKAALKLPRALVIGTLLPSTILDYVQSLDCASIFHHKLKEIEEFTEMFPNEEDQLDFTVLSRWANLGRYESSGDTNKSSSSSSSYSSGNRNRNVGISTLFHDLDRMIANAKEFNGCNPDYLPWCQADMTEVAVKNLKKALAVEHPSIAGLIVNQTPRADSGNGSSMSTDTDLLGLDAEL